MSKKKATMAESEHMGKVAALGCIACRKMGYEDTPAEIHHLRDGQGAGQRAGHYQTIPLCPHHHRNGNDSIHRGRNDFIAKFGSERELLEETLQDLGL